DVPQLEEHLMVCAVCTTRLDEIEEFAVAMRQALTSEPVPAETSIKDRLPWLDFGWMRRPVFSIAVGFAALVLAIAVFSTGRSNLAPVAALQLTPMRGEMPLSIP